MSRSCTRMDDLGGAENPSRRHLSSPRHRRHRFPPLLSASPCWRSAPGSMRRWHLAMATSWQVTTMVERQCLHAQSPEVGWGGAPWFSASRVLIAGGDASTRVRLSNISTSSLRSVHQSCAFSSLSQI